jgi:hypothetical protein
VVAISKSDEIAAEMEMARLDQNVHSDFLVHWTGRDIDKDDTRWEHPRYVMSDAIAQRYADRLASILEYGFWMMREPKRRVTVRPHKPIEIPPVVRTSFTALKLSASRQHAHQYGRLGIGVKRPYAVNRKGRTLIYYAYSDQTSDPLVYACLRDLKERELLGYFQPMNRKPQTAKSGKMVFDLYAETEWRIILRPELEQGGWAVDPPASWHGRPGPQPEKLLPLDGWLAIIVYPSIEVKRICREPGGPVVRAIERIKSNIDDHGNRVEPGNWPAELNLDDCRNL